MTSFSETLMDHCQSPRNRGVMESADCTGTTGIPGQGRFIQLYLKLTAGRVERMQFECYGCGVTVAVCSVLAEMTEGLSKSACESITSTEIAEALDGIPHHKLDCAHFAVTALKQALQQWPAEISSPNDSQTVLIGQS